MPIVKQWAPSPILTGAAAYRTGQGDRGTYIDQLELQRAQEQRAREALAQQERMQVRDIGSREFQQGRDLANSEAARVLGFLSGERQQSRALTDAERARQFGFAGDQSLQNQRIQQANMQQLLGLLDTERGREFQGGENQQQRDLQRELQTQDIQFRQGESAAERQQRLFEQQRSIGANLAGQAAGLSQSDIESLRADQRARDLQAQQIAEQQRAQTAGAVIDLNRQIQGQDFADYTLDRTQQQDIQDRLLQGGVDDALQQPRLQASYDQNLIAQQAATQRQAMSDQAQFARQMAEQQFRGEAAQFDYWANSNLQGQRIDAAFAEAGYARAYQMEDRFIAEQQKFGAIEDLVSQGYQFSPGQQQLRDQKMNELQEVQSQSASGRLAPHVAQQATYRLMQELNTIVPRTPPPPPFDPQQYAQSRTATLPNGQLAFFMDDGKVQFLDQPQQQRPIQGPGIDQLSTSFASVAKNLGPQAAQEMFGPTFQQAGIPLPQNVNIPQTQRATPEQQFQQRTANQFMTSLMRQTQHDVASGRDVPLYTPQQALDITRQAFPGAFGAGQDAFVPPPPGGAGAFSPSPTFTQPPAMAWGWDGSGTPPPRGVYDPRVLPQPGAEMGAQAVQQGAQAALQGRTPNLPRVTNPQELQQVPVGGRFVDENGAVLVRRR